SLRFRHGQHIVAVAYSPDGRTIASAGRDGRVVLHDLATGKKLRSFGGETPYASSVAFAPDGKTLAARVGSPQGAVWGVATGKRLRRLQATQGSVASLAYSRGGRMLVGGARRLVHVWDMPAGREIGRIAPPPHFLALTLARDGKTLATASYSKRTTSVCVWETVSGRKLHEWPAHKGEGYSLAFSPDGKRLASASIEGDNRLRVWTVPKGEQQLELPGEFHSLRFSPCGKVLAAAANGSVFLWEADTGKETRRLPGGGRWTPRGDRVLFSPDG